MVYEKSKAYSTLPVVSSPLPYMFSFRFIFSAAALLAVALPSTYAMELPDVDMNRVSLIVNVAEAMASKEVISACPNRLSPDPYTLLFTDVKREDSTYFNQTCFLMRAGIIKGYSDGSLRPQATITRAEAAKVLAKAFLPDAVIAMPDSALWYMPYVTALKGAGVDILKGYRASDGITYDQMRAAIDRLYPARSADTQ